MGVSPSLLPSAALAGVRVSHAGARPEARLVTLLELGTEDSDTVWQASAAVYLCCVFGG